MEQRRKIIIQTGADAEQQEASAARPFFNTEATRAARPVVPLPESAMTQTPAAGTPRTRRVMFLSLLVMAAIGIGVAAGLAISGYQRSLPAPASVAVRPVASKSATTLPWTHTPEEPLTEEDSDTDAEDIEEAVVQLPEETPAQPPVRTDDADREKRERKAERDEERRDRREQQAERADDERDQRRQDRGRGRGRRDRPRDDDDLPQDPIIRRTRDDLHRIREIFEGIP